MAAHQPIRRRSILLADNETAIGEPMSCRPVSAPSIPLARHLMWRPLLLKPAEADTTQDVNGWRVWKMLCRKKSRACDVRSGSWPCQNARACRTHRVTFFSSTNVVRSGQDNTETAAPVEHDSPP
jgi:hypothetical protein